MGEAILDTIIKDWEEKRQACTVENYKWLIEQAKQTADLAVGYSNSQKEIMILKNKLQQKG